MIRDALILAAGLGSRLEHMTQSLPKALIPVNGIPIMEIQVDALIENNISNINIVCGYKAKLIKDFIGKRYGKLPIHFNFINNDEYKITNSAYSFWLAYKAIYNKDFIHMNCDNIFTSKVLNQLIRSKQSNCLITRKQKLTDNMEQVKIENNRITEMRNMSFEEAQLKAMGLAKISPQLSEFLFEKISKEIKVGDRNGNFYGAIRDAIGSFSVYSIESTNNIFEVNNLIELSEANKIISKKSLD
jgi:choline kinase